MKKSLIVAVATTLFLSSCSVQSGLTRNFNHHTTEVNLSRKNFTVVDNVQGESEATYVLGIGGLTKNAMIAEARAKMLAKANIIGSSKAIVNETVEVKHSFFPLVRLYKVIVSGNVIEFTE